MRNRAHQLTLALIFLPALCLGQTYTYSTLVTFTGSKHGPQNPNNLIIDTSGNLYGTSYAGGKYGFGTVFKVSTAGVVTVLHSFAGMPSDGAYPYDALARDKSSGNLYGTTYSGGTVNTCSGRPGCGTVFKLTTKNVETILHDFENGSDGQLPGGGVALDSSGDAFGLSGGVFGPGVIYEINTADTFSTIYTFSGGTGFGNTLIRNSAGDLFGTSFNFSSPGSVFKVTPEGTESTLYTFTGGSDGYGPNTKLTQDSAGNLYGSTYSGGAKGSGTVFKLNTSNVFSVLYSFCQLTKCADGSDPSGWLTLDSSGNLYGVTGGGLVFKVTSSGKESVIYSGLVGTQPNTGSGLVIDKSGNLYGSMFAGNGNDGFIYKLTKQ